MVSPTSQRTQAKIIEATVNTIATYGISGTTIANVAKEAGVSQGVLVFHFISKEGLLAETLRRLTDEYRTICDAALSSPDPLERILGLIHADFNKDVCSVKKLAIWYAFWGEATAQSIYKDICEDNAKWRYRAMVDACENLISIHGGPDPDLLAQSIDGMSDGLWLQMHINGIAISRTEALDKAIAHLKLLLPNLKIRT